ncbi:MAG: tetratricopeptide repeat protein [Lentisphaeria bacterium]|jgi:tetratricopeptide (TPR) repeat protein|nr:tetratricopeptide repeat protein [Lentisphaeria bacterium]
MRRILKRLFGGGPTIESALALYRAGRFADALKQADTLIERAPELAMGWRFKGECLFELQQYGESIVAFRVAQNFGGPGTEDLFLWIALCCARDNRVGDATDVLNKFIAEAGEDDADLIAQAKSALAQLI